MGEELLDSPTPTGQGPRRGAYIVGYYGIVASVEVDRPHRRPNMGTSQNCVKRKSKSRSTDFRRFIYLKRVSDVFLWL
jgi:hypothetical protein